MNVLSILLPDLRGGGAERVNLDLAREFAQAGYRVEFVLMQARGEFLEEAQNSFVVVDLQCSRARSLPLALIRYLRRRRPKALLAAMWPLTVIAPVAVMVSGHRCSVLISEHGMLSAQYRYWGYLHQILLRGSIAFGYRLAQHRVGVSSGLVDDMVGLAKMNVSHFHVIHNPVPQPSKVSDEAIKAVEKMWDGSPGARILTVGSMKNVKNHPFLLRSFAKVTQKNAQLMFVGDGQGRDELVALARELGVQDRVIFAGFHSDPTPFYLTADLFALSSDYEGFGNVIVEAMNCGTPVVSTDCPSGPAEILENGRYGRLAPVGDIDAMATALAATLEDPLEAEVLQRRAADFRPTNAARAYLNLLEL